MLNIYQQTITKPLSFCGIGLHSGKKTKITIYPGKEDQGIIFKRVDLTKNNVILADYNKEPKETCGVRCGNSYLNK